MFADNVVDGIGRDESRHISCGYVGNEANCPNKCGRCLLQLKRTAISRQLKDNSIMPFVFIKAVFIESKFSEACGEISATLME